MFYTILYVCIIKVLPIFSKEEANCTISKEIIKELSNRYIVSIIDPELSFAYELEDMRALIENKKIQKLALNTSVVTFTGTINRGKAMKIKLDKQITFDTKLIVIQRRQELKRKKQKNVCSLDISENSELAIGLPNNVEATLIQLSEFCIEDHICKNFDTFVSNQLVEKKTNKAYSFFSYLRDSLKLPKLKKRGTLNKYLLTPTNVTRNNVCNVTKMNSAQNTLNAVADFGLKHLTNKFTDGIIHIPDIRSNFTNKVMFWNVTGQFHASNGTFRNMTFLERINDVTLSHKNLRFEITSTLGLKKGKLFFKNYGVNYGKLKIHGRVTVHLSEITVSSKVAVDFNERPCKAYLMHFKMHDLKKIDVVLSGFGALNRQAASVVSWIIKSKSFKAIKIGVDKSLAKFQCEKFRP